MVAGTILLLGLMGLTAVVLVAGIFLMARGGAANAKYNNRLMSWRVMLQGAALALMAVLLMMKEG